MIELQSGILYYPEFLPRGAQENLVEILRGILKNSPLFVPKMPKTGKEFSVRMSNCGALGWVSDESGYRYQPAHPVTNVPWPPIPPPVLDIWRSLSGFVGEPEACLINYYEPNARMGLHQDRDEEELAAPVVSLSLGDTCLFRYGSASRNGPTRSVKLASGDVLVLGGAARLAFHGVDRLMPGTSTLLEKPGRINLTLRRVTKAWPGNSSAQ